MYLCAMSVPGAQEGQMRIGDPLEFELQMLVICPVGAG